VLVLSGGLLLGLATVAIELPPDPDERRSARVVESCESVLGEGECVDARVGTPAKWVATVVWDAHRLTITLRRSDAATGAFVARTQLDFSPQDEDEQRWVASGLMVAALAAAQPRSVAPAPEPAPEPEPAPAPEPAPEPEPEPPAPSRPSTFVASLDLGGLAGVALDRGAPRSGGQGRLALLWGRPSVGVVGGVRGAWRGGEPTVRWLDGSLGFAVRPTGRGFELDLSGEAVVQSAQARASQDGTTSARSSLRSGGRAGVTMSVRLAPAVGLWIGGDVTVLRPELEIRLNGETVGREPPARWAVGSGVRFRLHPSTVGVSPRP